MLDIPLRYIVARTADRPWPIVAAVGVALAVMIAASTTHALYTGVVRTWLSGGRPDSATLMNTSAGTDPRLSNIDAAIAPDVLLAMANWCRPSPDGPLCSPESLLDARVAPIDPAAPPPADSLDAEPTIGTGALGVVRGVTPVAWLLHPQMTFTAGRRCRQPGELVVGELAAMRLGLPADALAPGRKLFLLNREWTIVGCFRAPGDEIEAELWCPLDDVRDLRPLSIIRLGLRDANAVSAPTSRSIVHQLDEHPEWNLTVRRDDERSEASRWYADTARLMSWLAVLLVALCGAALQGLISRTQVDDHRDDIALLGRLGAHTTVVEWQIVWQSVMPVIVGSLAGWLITAALDGLPVMPGNEPLRLMMSLECHVLGVLAVLVAATGGIWPALGLASKVTGQRPD